MSCLFLALLTLLFNFFLQAHRMDKVATVASMLIVEPHIVADRLLANAAVLRGHAA
jgi:hypothetical protein